MPQKIRKVFLVTLGFVLGVGFLILGMRYYTSNRESVESESQRGTLNAKLRYQSGEEAFGHLVVPVRDGVAGEDVLIENQYMSGKILVTIQGMDGSFIGTEGVGGSLEHISEVKLTGQRPVACLEVAVDGVYACESEIQDNKLCVWLKKPEEIYQKRIVIDVGHGGDSDGAMVDESVEKEILLEIAEKLKVLLDESDIQVYYTRLSDVQITLADRVKLADEVKADLFVSLHLAEDKDTSKCGICTYYNGSFYSNGIQSGSLAYCIQTETIEATGGISLGIVPGEDKEYVLYNCSVPSAVVRVGYLTNAEERKLLERSDYQDRIALGIYEGILAAYKED